MAYISVGAFNHYINISVSTGRLDEDDREDDEGYDLLTDLDLATEDCGRPSMGFCKPL